MEGILVTNVVATGLGRLCPCLIYGRQPLHSYIKIFHCRHPCLSNMIYLRNESIRCEALSVLISHHARLKYLCHSFFWRNESFIQTIQCGHPRAEMTFAVNNAMIWYHSKNGWPILEPGQLFLSIWPKWCISDRDKKVSLLREGLDWDEGLRNGIYEVEDMSTCPRTFRRMSKHPKIPGCLDVYI